ncbi:MAG: indole-3-glycerol phosphate synthase TrpC [candidate division Zixibacteria bacterium]|nr:indole-3-glycerol phosphate synthase TrpC [candidate division Zixibacteria bacterium]MBU1470248.1 indole-3-glycerol phosphate synthase TrpC [candidate division Zixibacteria bacterium]MBU2626434.1 indole-3-glycerol phosphate synthase TrpC [candidate division Zixibacteria bacterium]
MLSELAQHTRERWQSVDRKALTEKYTRMIESVRAPRSLIQEIQKDQMLSFLFEIKRKSPSKGEMNSTINPVRQALLYQEYHAAGVSVITEEKHFGGSLDDLSEVSATVDIPVLRKDFVIDKLQVLEARAHGADVILLIVKLLAEETADYLRLCAEYGLEAIVEIHSEDELQIARTAGAKIIGINNRNLDTLEIDLDTTAKLLPKIPAGHIVISESGITDRKSVDSMRVLGVDAVLIGSVLSLAESVEAKLEELTECRRR